MTAIGTDNAMLLALAVENAELRLQLGESQDQLVEMALDAGEMHAALVELREDLAAVRAERDAWRIEAVRAKAGRAA